MRQIFEQAVAADRFSSGLLADATQTVHGSLENRNRILALERHVGHEAARKLVMNLMRWSFLIELVKEPKIETTKMEVRWAERLPQSDPRHASYNECLAIFQQALADAEVAARLPQSAELLRLFNDHSLLPYELPIDYAERRDVGQHTIDNVVWLWDGVASKVVKLRKFLTSNDNPRRARIFKDAYEGKIKVKTYLTDRVLTGTHKTNREKRWETHPRSVHFAFRRDCLEIEYTLMDQLTRFAGFPSDLRSELVRMGVVEEPAPTYRCPITMDTQSYDGFVAEIGSPDHGRSAFQVGHLNPLKAVNNDRYSGHTAANIAWVSADGNRIQGSMSLGDTRLMVRQIVARYDEMDV